MAHNIPRQHEHGFFMSDVVIRIGRAVDFGDQPTEEVYRRHGDDRTSNDGMTQLQSIDAYRQDKANSHREATEYGRNHADCQTRDQKCK